MSRKRIRLGTFDFTPKKKTNNENKKTKKASVSSQSRSSSSSSSSSSSRSRINKLLAQKRKQLRKKRVFPKAKLPSNIQFPQITPQEQEKLQQNSYSKTKTFLILGFFIFCFWVAYKIISQNNNINKAAIEKAAEKEEVFLAIKTIIKGKNKSQIENITKDKKIMKKILAVINKNKNSEVAKLYFDSIKKLNGSNKGFLSVISRFSIIFAKLITLPILFGTLHYGLKNF